LRRNPNFTRLWAAQTISVFGSLISRTAIPFTAILTLEATPLQMALLNSADLLAGLLVGLAAGVWVDRLRRRPVLIITDLARAALLLTVPLAAWLHLLRIEQLYAVAFAVGLLTFCFDTAYRSYLPSLVRPGELVPANSRLTASESAAEVGAFGLGGWLVQLLSAPLAVLIDAVSFLGSAALVAGIRAPEPPPVLAAKRESIRREIAEGLRAVAGSPLLRPLAVSEMLLQFSHGVVGTVILLYVTRELGFSPGVQGMIYAVGGASSLAGAVVAGRVARRWGIGPTLVMGLLIAAIGGLCTPLARGATAASAALLVTAQLVTDPAATIYQITETSLRQAITPDRLLGRVNASIRFAGLGVMLLGTLLAGSLGEVIGLRATLLIGAAGPLLAALLLALSPVRGLRAVPAETTRPGAA
jgi:MFS family permease